MREWTVEVDWDATVPVTSDLLGQVAEIGGACAGEPERTRVETILTVEADDPSAAAAKAIDEVTTIIPGSVIRVEVMTTEEQDRQLAEPSFPELVGISEIAALLGVTRQRASALQTRQGFPAPVAVLASGPVWRRVDLSRFEETWERKGGRPAKVAS